MLTGENKSKIDKIWDAFWSGGISTQGNGWLKPSFDGAGCTDFPSHGTGGAA